MNKLRRAKIIVRVLIIITVLLWISGKSKYILSICQYVPYPNILYYSVIITGAVTCIILLPQQKKTQKSYILVILACFITCLFIWYNFLLISDPKVTCKVSPDGKHEIVFFEYDHMVDGLGYIYEKVSPLYMQYIGGTAVNWGTPIRDGNYLIEWNEDNFILCPAPGKHFWVETIPYADQQ